MKVLNILTFLIFSVVSYSQQSSEAIKTDEIGRTGCESLLSRSLTFGETLRNDPSKRGVVIYYLPDSVKTDSHVRFIHTFLITRYSNNLNVTFLKAVDREIKTEFWLVPKDLPFQPANTVVSLRIPLAIDKKILFGYDDPGPCTGHVFYGFVEMLRSNPNLSGYIVNYNLPRNDQKQVAASFRKELKQKSIADRGIRIYFRNVRTRENENYGLSEYWLYPLAK